MTNGPIYLVICTAGRDSRYIAERDLSRCNLKDTVADLLGEQFDRPIEIWAVMRTIITDEVMAEVVRWQVNKDKVVS